MAFVNAWALGVVVSGWLASLAAAVDDCASSLIAYVYMLFMMT